MAVLIASISAPSVSIATLVSKAVGKRFSLKDETGTTNWTALTTAA